jgi:hypothetical protein
MLLRLDHADRPEGGPFVAKTVFFRQFEHQTSPNGQGSLMAELFLVTFFDRLSQPMAAAIRCPNGLRRRCGMSMCGTAQKLGRNERPRTRCGFTVSK